jgi:hypothetical protein
MKKITRVFAGCCCVLTVTSVFMIWMGMTTVRCGCMDYQNGSTCLIKKDSAKDGERLEQVSLRDVPLEIRRKEAKKPLFLVRYE